MPTSLQPAWQTLLKGGLSLEENGEAGGEEIQQVSKLELIRCPRGEENLELGFGAPGLMGVTAIYKTRCWIATVFLFLTTFCLSLSTSDAVAAAAAAEGHSEKSASKKTDWDQSKSHHGAVSLKLMHREQVALALGLAVVPPAQQQLPQLVANAIARSKSRVRYLNSRVVAKLGLKNSHAHQFVVAQASAAASLINAAPPAVASASGLLSSPASGGGQEYFVSLKLGNPPQEVLLAVDTGSEISWVQCTPCVVCYNQILPIYDPNKSSSYTVFDCSNKNCHITDGVSNVCSQGDGTCAYAATYGDGSDTWGSLSSETFTMESSISSSSGSAFVAAQEVIFGCGRLNQGLFVGSSGLLGLDRGTFSFATQMGVSFSYCMIDRMKTPNATSSLVFGSSTSSGSAAAAADQPASAFAYTSMLNTAGKAPGFYYVSLVGIRVGKQQLPIDFSAMELNPNGGGGGTIIDSGTYISFLPEQVYLPLQDAILKQSKLELLVAGAPPWSDLIPGGLQTCFLLPKSSSHHKSRSEESGMPPVILQFEGNVDMELDFHNVIIGPFDPGTNELYCLAFLNSGPLQQPPSMCVAVIIGNVQQQNFLINFDLSNSRVGFKKTDCATAASG